MQRFDTADVQDYFRRLFSWKERRSGMIMPDERLPWADTTVMGLQHVLAMFGSTVLAPILMGFDPNTAIFFSGIGTILFFIITGGKIPSYLGSSFAFIAPVGAVMLASGSMGHQYALGGIVVTGLVYTLIGFAVHYFGSEWIDKLMPPIVTGGVVAIIGLNLAHAGAKPLAESNMPLALITILSILGVAMLGKGLVGRLPILIGTFIGWLFAALLGGTTSAGREVLGIHFQGVNLQPVKDASLLGLPNFTTPRFDGNAIGLLAPVAIILVAENTGHIKAVSEMTRRNMMPYLGRGFIGDGVATMVAGFGGGTGVTTYAENIGVMAVTKVFSTAIFIIAAGVAVLLGFSPMFGALVLSIPAGVLGGVAVVLFGLIAAAGIRIWIDNQVDFSKGINLFLASVTLLVGTADLTMHIGDFALNGIALGTFGSIILYQIFNQLPGARDDDPGATPASAGEPDLADVEFRREPRREDRRRQPRATMPPIEDIDEFLESEAPPRRQSRPQRPPQQPRVQQPPRPTRRPIEQREYDDVELFDEFGDDRTMPPPPRMPQPPTIRRNDPPVDDWDDDFGYGDTPPPPRKR